MPKALCITALVISFIVLLFFALDLVLGSMEATRTLAPFRGANKIMDLIFAVCAFGLGLMSWKTYREQV